MKLRNLVLGLMLTTTVFSAYGKSSDYEECSVPHVNIITIHAEISDDGFMSRNWKIDEGQSRAKCNEYARLFDKKCGKVVGFDERRGIFISYEFLDR